VTTTSPSNPEREEQLLRLQRMEDKLITGLFEHPGVVTRRAEHQLRYALALASLEIFQPGAAKKGGRTKRPDVKVRSQRLGAWRRRVIGNLGDILIDTKSSRERVELASRALFSMLPNLEKTRAEVIEKYANDFSERELDEELGTKTLVCVAGGGGGAGYVYLGAWEVLQNAGLVPGYLIGASIGSVLGLFRAQHRQLDFDESVRVAKSMKGEEIFRFVSLNARFGLPGVVRLFLHTAFGRQFPDLKSRSFELPDLAIPFETVVAGVRRNALDGLGPEEYARAHHLPADKRPSGLQLRAQIASQLVQVAGFINPRAVQEIVIGGDDLTRRFNAIDAAGFSAAIPGILHYDVTRDDAHMQQMLTDLMEREDVTALVDGGVANNVPSRTAWRQVQAGKIGTRNTYILAFDCFHPSIGLKHLVFQPITRVIAYQVALNERYARKRIEFKPTLSPINLLPSSRDLDKAVQWGRHQMSEEIAHIQKYFERVKWVAPTH
jgi:predicted acylesterase/phospholipase RssA